MAPLPEETEKAYLVRIRDKWGVIDTPRQQGVLAFEWARRKIQSDLTLRGLTGDALEIASLHYGTGFASEWRRVEASRKLRESENWPGSPPYVEIFYTFIVRLLPARTARTREPKSLGKSCEPRTGEVSDEALCATV